MDFEGSGTGGTERANGARRFCHDVCAAKVDEEEETVQARGDGWQVMERECEVTAGN
jgi:hypothetical protein